MVEVLYDPLLICGGYCALMQQRRVSQKEGGGDPDTTKSIIHFLQDRKAFQHIVKLKSEALS